MLMSSTAAPRRSSFATDWAAEPPFERQALRKGTSRGFTRVLIAFGIGIAATLAWQYYGDAAREVLAERYLPLAWLAPPVPVAPPVPAAIVPPMTSPDLQDLKTISFGLATLRQRLDQFAADQDQMDREMTVMVQAAKQEILDKISRPSPQPAIIPARKPVLSASQSSPAR